MKSKAAIAALVLAGFTMGATVQAANTATITVNATVQSKCSVTGSDTISLTIDPTLPGPISAQGAGVTYNCTKGVTPGTITFLSANTSSTASWQLKSTATPADTIVYTPALVSAPTAGQGFGTGTGQTATVKVSVVAADYQNAPAHADYADTITLTIAP